MSLPEKGWKGYGRPGFEPFGLRVRVLDPRCAFPNADGLYRLEMDAEVAEYRLRHDGIKADLLAYLRGIGEAYRG